MSSTMTIYKRRQTGIANTSVHLPVPVCKGTSHWSWSVSLPPALCWPLPQLSIALTFVVFPRDCAAAVLCASVMFPFSLPLFCFTLWSLPLSSTLYIVTDSYSRRSLSPCVIPSIVWSLYNSCLPSLSLLHNTVDLTSYMCWCLYM